MVKILDLSDKCFFVGAIGYFTACAYQKYKYNTNSTSDYVIIASLLISSGSLAVTLFNNK